MDMTKLIILALATWRIAYMLVQEDGPRKIFERLRHRDKSGVFDCIYCTSVHVGFWVFFLWFIGWDILAYPFALSGLALMLRAYTGVGLNDV